MPFPETTDALVDIFPGDTQRSKSHRVRHNAANEALREHRDYLQGDIEDRISALEGGGGGGGGGGIRLVDLGVVDITDRLTTDATLYTPASGELVLGLRASDVVAVDTGESFPLEISQDPDGQAGQLATNWNGNADQQTVNGNPIVARAPMSSVSEWQANFDYPDEAISVIGAGHLWSLSGVGTSGATEPDWASYIDGSAPDGGTSWVDQGPLPTVGSVHLYALVGTAVAP